MKPAKIFTAVLILLASFQICFGQEKPVAFHIDTFEDTSCSDLWGRLTGSLIDSSKNQNSIFYIIIYSENDNSSKGHIFEQRILSTLTFSRLDKSRIVIAHAAGNSLKAEIWLVPSGAAKPVFEEIKPKYSLKIDKPLIYYERGGVNECPVGNIEEIYSKILLENTNLRGNIVINETSLKKFQKMKRLLTAELVKKYKVPLKRIRFYLTKAPDLWSSDVEFWLVPSKKK